MKNDTGLDVTRLETSFALVAPKGDALVARFYERLFERYPAVKPMFKNVSMAAQRKSLLGALVLTIKNLRHPKKLTAVLQQLGQRHAGYGAQPAHYDAVAENLIAVLQEFAGKSWSKATTRAWSEALGTIKTVMLEGTNDVHHAAPAPRTRAAAQPKEEKVMATKAVEKKAQRKTTKGKHGADKSQDVFIKSALDNVDTHVLMCDRDLTVTYMNEASKKTLTALESEIRKVMPGFAVDRIVGTNIDAFHKNPSYQRGLLADPSNLPRIADIQLGPATLNLKVSAVMSDVGDYLGNVVEWEDVTAKRQLELEMTRLKSSLDNANSNVIVADRDYNIVYVNNASVKALSDVEQEIQKVMPAFRVDKVVGSNIDMYHKNPAHQRRLLDDPKNLPHRAEIEIGPLKLDLNVSAIMSESGEYLGNVVEWEEVTVKRQMEIEMARLKSSLDNANSNVIVADRDYNIVYVNNASVKALSDVEQEIQKVMPAFRVDKVVGSNIDMYHKNPAHQRRLLDDPKNLPHRAEIEIGPLKLDLNVSAVISPSGEYVGNVVEWEDVTAQKKAQSEVERMIRAAAEGQLSERIDVSEFKGFFKVLSEGINNMLDTVVTPLHEAQSVLAALAEGKLTEEMSGAYKGEFEQMKTSLNSAIENLTGVITRTRDVASEVTTGASQISRGNDDLSERTSQQASALEETSSSMEEMTSTVKQNADNAAQANQLGIAARETAEKGGTVVSEAINAMGEINKSSKKIADIITVIDEIAFQTNLLALNAAVEAARAGEQGRGFAVVAAEVRNLAGRSAGAAKEIKGLISESVQLVTEGTNLVNKSGESLEEIVGSVKRVTDIVGEISAASQEQSTGIDQVNKAIMEMDQTTQQNSALVEEASAASQNLATQAQELMSQVEFFTLKDTGQASGPAVAKSQPTRNADVRPAAKPRVAERQLVGAGVSASSNGHKHSDEDFEEF